MFDVQRSEFPNLPTFPPSYLPTYTPSHLYAFPPKRFPTSKSQLPAPEKSQREKDYRSSGFFARFLGLRRCDGVFRIFSTFCTTGWLGDNGLM